MKKLFIGVAFAGSLFINAQEKTKSSSPITFGVKAGLNASTISRSDDRYYESGDHNDEDKLKVGFQAGVFVNIPVAEKFSIQPELLFSQLGSKVEETYSYYSSNYGFKSNFEYKANLNYLTLPVMVQYNILPQLYVEAGPEFGYLLGGKIKGDDTRTTIKGNSTTISKESYSEDLPMDLYRRFNFGIGIGAGYYFTQNFGVTARFTAGISNIMKETDYKMRNNAFQVGVAYKFK
ncbi:uncharacterized protein CHSO_2539 [Chryseobacterium sp. StRB126]|uniref:porin family protein n=1 Tax=Chryseobacterium sp. StRB126 TaxID=878220 RepID=UPI0004E98294|nr:porin family protein [Chryseobacterium sp. StRB126]BAP31576.1 uncharacterized protein CHSO_2539 [Chryseobacterium sp. StRB126]